MNDFLRVIGARPGVFTYKSEQQQQKTLQGCF